MSDVERLRSALPWAKDMTDAELLGEVSRRTKTPITDVAGILGVRPGGKWGERGSAAVDSAQASLYGVGEAAGLGDWAMRGRKRNDAAADLSRGFARQQGAVMSAGDVGGIGDVPEYVGGLLLDTAPQLAAMGAAGVGGTLATGNPLAGVAAAGTVGYNFALGDVLQNQRDQAGRTDLLSAAALAVPYAAVDTLTGVGGKVVTRSLGRSGLKALDNITGVKGVAARTAASAGRTAAVEGAGETFQEGMNQLGRMAVDPNETFLNERSAENFQEAFIGGAALGGAFGTVGGHRRSKSYEAADVPVNPQGKTDLLTTELGAAPATTAVEPEASPLGDLTPDWQTSQGFEDLQREPGLDAAGMYPAVDEPSLVPRGTGPATADADSSLAMPAVNFQPDVLSAESLGGVGGTDQDNELINDPGAVLARQRWIEQRQGEQAQQASRQAADTVAQEIAARDEKAKGYGLKGTAAFDTFGRLTDALDAGVINQAQFDENVGLMKVNRRGQVEKFLKGVVEQKALIAKSDADQIADAYAKLQKPKGQAADVPKPAEPGTQASPATSTQVAPQEGQVAGIPAGKVATVGRAGREVQVTPVQLLQKIQAASPLDKLRIMAVTGTSVENDPTTGAPRLVNSAAPMTFDEVAREEAKATGKKVTKQAIGQALAKFGINEDVATKTAAGPVPSSVSAEELGIDRTEGGAAGFREESRLSKATGQGLIDDGSAPSAEQRRLTAEADRLLANATRDDVVDAPSAAPTVEQDRAAVVAENIRQLLADPEYAAASADWDGATVAWGKLPDTLKADWVSAYLIELDLGEGSLDNRSFRALDGVQQRIEKDYAYLTSNAGGSAGATQLGRTAEAQKDPRDVREDLGPGAGSAPVGTDPASGSGAYVGEAGQRAGDAPKPVVQVKKSRKAAIPTQSEDSRPAAGKMRVPSNDGKPWPYPFKMGSSPAAEATAAGQKAVVDYMNGDIDKDALVEALAQAKPALPQGVMWSITQRLDDFVNGDGQRVLARQKEIGNVADNSAQFSKAQQGGSTVARVMTEIAKLRLGLDPRKVVVVQSLTDLPPFIQKSVEDANPQAFVLGGRAFLIADNIKPGNARAVFMHEVGAHMGLENLLSAKEFGRLAAKITQWADRNDASQESTLARLAIGRVGAAGTEDAQVQFEQVAYFIEEAVKAGIDPTALKFKGELARWMAELVRALRAGLAKLGLVNAEGLTAQDVVDMAYGAAQLELQVDNRGGPDGPKFSIDRSLPKPVQKTYSAVGQVMSDVATKGKLWGAFTEDLARMASKVIPSAAKYIGMIKAVNVVKTRAEREIESIISGYGELPAHERGTGPSSVNQFLMKSTMDKKWGFKPEYHDSVEVDKETAERFNRLSPAAQSLVKAVFKHGHDNLQQLKAAMVEEVTSEHDLMIAEAERAGDAETLAEAKEAKLAALKHISALAHFNGDWPYAPLKRFGNEVVIGMSKAYRDAEAGKDWAEVRRLQSDPAHYNVSFFETRGEARAAKASMEASGVFGEGGYVDNFNKDDGHETLYGGRDTLSAFRRLRGLVADTADPQLTQSASKSLNRLMNDLHLTLLAESSARQSERNRVGVAGADEDMMRAFVTQGRASAHFIAALKSGGKITEVLHAMKAEADERKPGREERRDYFNELLKRHVMGMDYNPSPLIDKAMRVSSFYMLLTSPAYFFLNATQPLAMSLPVLASFKGHGYTKSAAAMMKAYRELLPLIKGGGLSQGVYDALPEDVRGAVQTLADRGVIEISLEQELGRWRSTDDSKLRHFNRVMDKIQGVTQGVETMNRLVTAITAIRLARDAGANPEAQVDSAAKVIYDTHGDYSGFNAPRLMRTPAGRLLTQFRKFQLIQLSMYARLLHGAFKGATPDERLVAKKALAYSLSHMFVLGGALGLPGAQAVGWILGSVFGDDDEPDNPEMTLRKLIGDEDLADLLLKGLPKLAGVDLSGRIGAGGMLSLLPYADTQLSRDGAESTITAAMGPFVGGLLPRFADGAGMIAQGDYVKGLENLLPKGLADSIKAMRFASEGVTQRNGDVVMTPDEITFVDALFQAAGLPTNAITDRSLRASAKFKADQFYNDRTKQVKRQYTEAYRSGDGAAMAEARQAWVDLQLARVRNGYDRRPLADLLKAPREQIKRERNTTGGVQYRRGDQQMVEQLDELT